MAAPLTTEGLDDLRKAIKKVQEEEVNAGGKPVSPDAGGTTVSPDEIKPGMLLSVTTGSKLGTLLIVLERLSDNHLRIAHVSLNRQAFTFSQSAWHYCKRFQGYVSLDEPEEISALEVSNWKASMIKNCRLDKLFNDLKKPLKQKQKYFQPHGNPMADLLEPNKTPV